MRDYPTTIAGENRIDFNVPTLQEMRRLIWSG
jgi:hypothetical protein